MHKKEIASITGFLFLIIAIGLFYFNEDITITGFVVKEKPPEVYGTYSIKPSFKVNVDYDFEVYEEIKNKAKEIVRDCKDDVENCANKKINIFNDEEILKAREQNIKRKFKWSSGCETEEEKFFYNFVENYKLCLDSKEKEGVCEFYLSNGPKGKKLEIKLTDEEEKIKIELQGTQLTERIDTEGPFIAKDTVSRTRFDFDITAEFDKDGVIKKSDFKPLGKSSSNLNNQIKLFKEVKGDKTYISFIDPSKMSKFEKEVNSLDETAKNKFQKIPLKRDTYKFCVNSSKKFYVYDEDKIELKNVEYKFALKLIDRTPPPVVEDIEVKDKIKDENSVLVLWNKPPVDDINEYYIFYSEKDFKIDETETIIKDNEIKKIKISENEKIEIEDIDLDACHFIESEKPCFYNEYDKPLEKNKLYFWKKEDKDRYIYVLDDIKENAVFNFMVVAIDHAGNMINNKDEKQKFTQLYPGNSIDDLPPGIINTIKAQSQGGKVILSWDRETYNLDGGIAYDVESFNVYYKVQEPSQTTLTDNIGKIVDITEPLLFNQEPTIFRFNSALLSAEQANCKFLINTKCKYTLSSQPELGKVHLWGVTALDEATNEHDKVFVRTLE